MHNHTPVVSLITSVYKAGKFIDQLLIDVTEQTIFTSHCEWIVMDASPPNDNSAQIAFEKLIQTYPEHITYIRLTEDPGLYEVWNLCIKRAKGQYLTNVNCDDRRAPDSLAKQLEYIQKNTSIDVVYGDNYISNQPNVQWSKLSGQEKILYSKPFSIVNLIKRCLPQNNPMWRRSLHAKVGYFNQEYSIAADWDFWLRAAVHGCQFAKLNTIIGIYYHNPKGLSTNSETNNELIQQKNKILENLEGTTDSPKTKRLIRNALFKRKINTSIGKARRFYKCGDKKLARSEIRNLIPFNFDLRILELLFKYEFLHLFHNRNNIKDNKA